MAGKQSQKGVSGFGPRRPLLSVAEEQRLARLARAGDPNARERLIEANVGLVLAAVRQYSSPLLEREDLIQEGIVGLIQACERFDPARKLRLSTYAVPCIHNAIGQALDERARLIRLPAQVGGLLRQAARLRTAWLAAHGVEPTDAQVAAELHVSLARLQACLRAGQPLLPLDGANAEGEETNLRAQIADAQAADPEAELIKNDMRRLLRALMAATLTEPERLLLSRRMGLENAGMTGESCRAMPPSPERARHMERLALQKLRRAAQEDAAWNALTDCREAM